MSGQFSAFHSILLCHLNISLWSDVLKSILMICQNTFKYCFPVCKQTLKGEIYSTYYIGSRLQCLIVTLSSEFRPIQRSVNILLLFSIWASPSLMMIFHSCPWRCASFLCDVSSGSLTFQHISRLHFRDIIPVFLELIIKQFNNV